MALFNTKMSKIKFDKFIKKLPTVIEAEQRNMRICQGDYSILVLILAKVAGTTPSWREKMNYYMYRKLRVPKSTSAINYINKLSLFSFDTVKLH